MCKRESRERTEKEVLDPRVLFSHLTPLGALKGWPTRKERQTSREREREREKGEKCLYSGE